MKKAFVLLFSLLASIPFVFATENPAFIIPQPNRVELAEGFFRLGDTLSVCSGSSTFDSLIPVFGGSALRYANITVVSTKKAAVNLILNTEIGDTESYRLIVCSGSVTVEASSAQGCFYGLQSLLQLMAFSGETRSIQNQTIKDAPRYAWRGLMLDESRHFFGMDKVKMLLDQMALLKLNRFHWHLSDAEGWRIEIKKYPRLTEVGAIGNYSDPLAPAQFYTQEQIKEIVAYASERFIQIIPEIDMPGHASAAVRAYPEISGGGSEKYPDFTFNPVKKETFAFLTDVLTEVSALFPSPYIHIGGDEVSYGNQQWVKLKEVKKLMRKNNYTDLLEVEYHFLQQIADSVQHMGKTLIGWDEIASAGIDPENRMIMWWRHDKPEVLELALNKQFKTVLCPRIPLYFDFVQDEKHEHGRKWAGRYADLASVYRFPSDEFVPATAIGNPLVMGIQANVWTETIQNQQRLEFMIFPRLAALAEAGWTAASMKNVDDFLRRQTNLKTLYRKQNITYFDPEKNGGKEITGYKKKQ
ncbi:MAG: beta-N-acetylhexosaminidase [Mangrovibacterium sp.]